MIGGSRIPMLLGTARAIETGFAPSGSDATARSLADKVIALAPFLADLVRARDEMQACFERTSTAREAENAVAVFEAHAERLVDYLSGEDVEPIGWPESS